MNSYQLIKKIAGATGFSFYESTLIYDHLLRTDYVREPEKMIGPREVRIVEDYLKAHPDYPLEYILGRTSFCGVPLTVDERVLIPRPETEELARHAEEEARSFTCSAVLDLCTGSGALAIYLAKKLITSGVWASDIDASALELAKLNAASNSVEISFLHGDFLAPAIERGLKFDLLVSNPPYVGAEDPVGAGVRYEPPQALYSEDDGTRSYQKIFKDLPAVLKTGAVCLFEISSLHQERMEKICGELLQGKFNYRFERDTGGRTRFLYLKRA